LQKKRLLASPCLSVCLSASKNPSTTGWIFMKFEIWGFFDNMSRKLTCD
jgi:hypothetical protein